MSLESRPQGPEFLALWETRAEHHRMVLRLRDQLGRKTSTMLPTYDRSIEDRRSYEVNYARKAGIHHYLDYQLTRLEKVTSPDQTTKGEIYLDGIILDLSDDDFFHEKRQVLKPKEYSDEVHEGFYRGGSLLLQSLEQPNIPLRRYNFEFARNKMFHFEKGPDYVSKFLPTSIPCISAIYTYRYSENPRISLLVIPEM